MEVRFLTFGTEKIHKSKLISKLHRYLRANLATYGQKCVADFQDYTPVTELKQAEEGEL